MPRAPAAMPCETSPWLVWCLRLSIITTTLLGWHLAHAPALVCALSLALPPSSISRLELLVSCVVHPRPPANPPTSSLSPSCAFFFIIIVVSSLILQGCG